MDVCYCGFVTLGFVVYLFWVYDCVSMFEVIVWLFMVIMIYVC